MQVGKNARSVEKTEDAAVVVREFEQIIRSKNKIIVFLAHIIYPKIRNLSLSLYFLKQQVKTIGEICK